MTEVSSSQSGLSGATLSDAMLLIAGALDEVGIAESRAEARLVVRAAGIASRDLIVDPHRRLEADECAKLERVLVRRLRREPITRIEGETEFFGRRFRTSTHTLDPRADTEVLVTAALELLGAKRERQRQLRILDVGTGTGCVLITLLAELPHARGLGTDVSEEALDLARDNADRLGVGARASFAIHDALDGIKGPFDIVVSNPPYIRSGDIDDLDPEVRNYDPRLALDGGPDGLTFYRLIARRLASVAPDGWAVVEVGAGQADDVELILSAPIAVSAPASRAWRDLAGHPRCVAIRTRA